MSVTAPAVATAAKGSAAPDELAAQVEKVFTEFTETGRVDPCKHSTEALQKTLDEMLPDKDEYPDFRPAVEAAIASRNSSVKCKSTKQPVAGATGKGTSKGGPSAHSKIKPPPKASINPPPVTPIGNDRLEDAPPWATDIGSAIQPPASTDEFNLPEEATSTLPINPPAATGAPLAAPPAAAPAPIAAAAEPPAPTTRRFPLAVVLLGSFAAGLALVGLVWLAIARTRSTARLAESWHGWGEVTFRSAGVWCNFRDWIRIGK